MLEYSRRQCIVLSDCDRLGSETQQLRRRMYTLVDCRSTLWGGAVVLKLGYASLEWLLLNFGHSIRIVHDFTIVLLKKSTQSLTQSNPLPRAT